VSAAALAFDPAQLEAAPRTPGELFTTALLITGSVLLAEEALEASTRALNPYSYAATHRQAVLGIVVRTSLAVASRAGFSQQATDAEATPLPLEVKRLLLLEGTPRRCFVLRRLCRFSRIDTALLLGLRVSEVDRRTRDAVIHIARFPSSR
jgi:hypothetical protein